MLSGGGLAIRMNPVFSTPFAHPQGAAMNRPTLKYLTRQWISLWCPPVDWPLFDRLHAESFEDYSAAGHPPDKMGFALGLAELTRAFPDLQTWIEDLVIDEQRSRVAVRWVAEGIHRVAFMGLEPNFQRTIFTGIEILEVVAGQITGHWGERDFPLRFQMPQGSHADEGVPMATNPSELEWTQLKQLAQTRSPRSASAIRCWENSGPFSRMRI